MSLKLTIGESSIIGPRERNEDYVGLVLPTDAQLATKGALLAVADGIGGNAGGREAAEMTVRTVCADYFATPDTWETHASLDTVITAANRWVLSQAAINSDLAGMATTLSLLILKGQHFVIAHVGDTRVYRLRNNELKQLTSDHVWDRPDMRHVLKRAVGLDQHLPIDYVDGQLEVGDVFAIVSDGVWGPLNKKDIRTALMQDSTPQMIGDHLTEKALAKGGLDNSTALIARVDALGADSLTDSLSNSLHLTVPTKLKIGEKIDEFEVLEILHDSRTNILYKVKSTTGQLFVLKTLQQQLANDVDSCKAL
ncbi:MAG: PP2C family serine/threonine-protein phosphatase, partial [Methylophilaceae bacterium]